MTCDYSRNETGVAALLILRPHLTLTGFTSNHFAKIVKATAHRFLIFTYLLFDIQVAKILKDALFLEDIKTLKFQSILVWLLDFIRTWLVDLLGFYRQRWLIEVLSTSTIIKHKQLDTVSCQFNSSLILNIIYLKEAYLLLLKHCMFPIFYSCNLTKCTCQYLKAFFVVVFN